MRPVAPFDKEIFTGEFYPKTKMFVGVPSAVFPEVMKTLVDETKNTRKWFSDRFHVLIGIIGDVN